MLHNKNKNLRCHQCILTSERGKPQYCSKSGQKVVPRCSTVLILLLLITTTSLTNFNIHSPIIISLCTYSGLEGDEEWRLPTEVTHLSSGPFINGLIFLWSSINTFFPSSSTFSMVTCKMHTFNKMSQIGGGKFYGLVDNCKTIPP